MRSTALRLTLAASLICMASCETPRQPPVRDARSTNELAYDLVGEGALVVLIHGSNLDRRMWDADVAWLQERARVLRYDLRGQGASADPEEAFSNHADLIALLDEIGEDEATLIGLSAGAQVALDAALEASHRVKRLILVSPSLSGYVPETMPAFFADLMTALKAGDFDQANEVLLTSSIMSVPPESQHLVRTMVADNSRLWTIPYSLVEQVSPPAIERLETIKASALILVGADDLEAIHAQGVILEQRLGDARKVTIPEGGHLLNLTSPDAFRREVSTFLNVPGE